MALKRTKCVLSDIAANAATKAITQLVDGGTLRIYAGRRPISADTPLASQALLAELTFASPAFAAPTGGSAKAIDIRPDTSANGGGEATWFRASGKSGNAVFDGDVGLLGRDEACLLLRHTTTVQPGAIVSISSLIYTQPKIESDK